jgi:hypothetical protein
MLILSNFPPRKDGLKPLYYWEYVSEDKSFVSYFVMFSSNRYDEYRPGSNKVWFTDPYTHTFFQLSWNDQDLIKARKGIEIKKRILLSKWNNLKI